MSLGEPIFNSQNIIMNFQRDKLDIILRGASIQASVLQGKYVYCAFVTWAAEEVTVTAEVYAVEEWHFISMFIA